MKKLTNEKYVAHGALICPSCESMNIESGAVENDCATAWASVKCHDCGATWDDVYALTGYENLIATAAGVGDGEGKAPDAIDVLKMFKEAVDDWNNDDCAIDASVFIDEMELIAQKARLVIAAAKFNEWRKA